MNISIFASIGCQNIGDELILKNEIELLRGEFGELSRFQVASYDHKNPVFQIDNTQYFEYFPLGIKNPKNILRNIKNFLKFLRVIVWSDIVVIGGGGIIYDSELQSVKNPLNQWIFRTKITRSFRKKIYFYALGIDVKNSENIKKLEEIFKNAWKITVRDEKSQKQLSDIGIESEIVDDPVMNEAFHRPSDTSLQRREEQKEHITLNEGKSHEVRMGGKKGEILGTHKSKNFTLTDFEKHNFQDKHVGLALRSGYIGKSGNSEIERLLVEELCNYIESKGGSIMFLPHSLHKTDLQANDYKFMKQFLTPKREMLGNLQDVYEWYREKKDNTMIVSMRLHSIILSYAYRIPQIVLSYSQKTDEVIKKLTN